MKVTSVEKKEYEEVMIDGVKYRRYDSNEWEHFGDHIFYYKNLEAAYQKFKNPPFTIEIDGDILFLTIGNDEFKVKYDKHNSLEKLEQALNSLMEGK